MNITVSNTKFRTMHILHQIPKYYQEQHSATFERAEQAEQSQNLITRVLIWKYVTCNCNAN